MDKADNMFLFKLLSCYLAAVVHDYQHRCGPVVTETHLKPHVCMHYWYQMGPNGHPMAFQRVPVYARVPVYGLESVA